MVNSEKRTNEIDMYLFSSVIFGSTIFRRERFLLSLFEKIPQKYLRMSSKKHRQCFEKTQQRRFKCEHKHKHDKKGDQCKHIAAQCKVTHWSRIGAGGEGVSAGDGIRWGPLPSGGGGNEGQQREVGGGGRRREEGGGLIRNRTSSPSP